MHKINIKKEDLIEYYVNQKLSTRECGKILNCDAKTVWSYLKKYEISLRICLCNDFSKIISKEILEEYYINQKLSSFKIGKLLNCTNTTILEYLRKFDIQARSHFESHLGQIPWNLGIPMSEETKKKESESQKALQRIGEKNPSWKSGITPINYKIRNSIEYKQWRKEILIRDDYICYKCRIKYNKLNVHHIINFSNIMNNENKLWNTDNGVTFCKKCHNEFHTVFGRKNNNQQQIFEFI